MKTLSLEEKRLYGPLLNELKTSSEQQFNAHKKQINDAILDAELNQKKYFDVTAYNRPSVEGGLHIYTHIVEELEDILFQWIPNRRWPRSGTGFL